MRSVGSGSTTSSTTNPVKLATGLSPIGSGVVPASGTTEINATGGWNKMRVDTYVTPAQATQPSNPFNDPFGDKRATQAANLVLQAPGVNNPPNTNRPGFNENAPGANPAVPAPAAPPPAFSPPFRPIPNPNQLPAPNPNVFPNDPAPPPAVIPSPMPNPPMPMPPENMLPERRNPADVDPAPVPMPGVPDVKGVPSDKDCQRRYGPNGELNCCDTDANCRAFVTSLMRDKLNHISLDISPRLQPDKDDSENAKARADASRLSGVRDWYRRGVKFEQRSENEPIARGRLWDMQNNRVIIKDESGQTQSILLNDLSEDDLCFVSGWWNLPAECAIAGTRQIDLYNRGWQPSTMTWTASALCHKPLYFEQVQHERYGHSAGPFRQPWIDGAHFFGSAIMLPYSMALDPPWECEYTLGYYRPGSCAPYHIPPFPFSPRAAMAQAGFVVGGIYVIP